MELLPEVDITPTMIAAIVERFQLGTRTATRFMHPGTSHTVYFLDDAFVLRVPRNHPSWFQGINTEARAVPAARTAQVHTPALVAADQTCELLPVPYTIYERIPGVALNAIDREPESIPEVWYALGQDLARLHTCVQAAGPLIGIAADTTDRDPRPCVAELENSGVLPAQAAGYLGTWLEALAPVAMASRPHSFCHGDVNLGNIMIDPASNTYNALIDWAGTVWGDNAYDLAVVSLRAAPLLLNGYRTIIQPPDPGLEARILWQHLRLALYSMRRAQNRNPDWIEQRLTRLFSGMQIFVASRSARWLTRVVKSPPEPPYE